MINTNPERKKQAAALQSCCNSSNMTCASLQTRTYLQAGQGLWQ
jgi:hypothetical protein